MDDETLEALLHPDPWTPKPPTPYDTGKRLEPFMWVNNREPGETYAVSDSYGKVDFDNEEGGTVATVWFEQDLKNGGYVMHVQPIVDPINLSIKWEEP
jgi:hypothetical protein